jgi:hypothetical protein
MGFGIPNIVLFKALIWYHAAITHLWFLEWEKRFLLVVLWGLL